MCCIKTFEKQTRGKIDYNPLDFYTKFGTSVILNSDNGHEFVNSIITELNFMWSDIKIVDSKIRHNQSQGFIEIFY